MKKTTLFLLSVCLVWPAILLSQQYSFLNYSVKNGLSNNVVKSIQQDDLGFLYFGTNSGLCVYDGSNLAPYPLPDQADHQAVFRMKRLEDGRLWINYTSNKTILTLGKGELRKIAPEKKLDINNIYTRLSPDTLICTDAGLFKWKESRLEKIETGISNKAQIIHFLYPVGADKLLVARKGFSLALVSRYDYQVIAESPDNVSVTDIAAALGGDIWLATDSRGFALLDGQQLEEGNIVFKSLPASLSFLSNEDIFCLTPNPENNSLLIGTTHYGIVVYQADGMVSFINKDNGLASNTIRCIFIDRDKNWWIGSNFGVDKLNNKDFVLYGKNNGLESGNIYPLCTDAAGRKWFFGKDNIYYWEGEQLQTLNYPDGIEKIVLGVTKTSDRIWVSAPEHIFYVSTGTGRPAVSKPIPTQDTYRRLLAWNDQTIILGGRQTLALLEHGQIKPFCDSIKDIRALLKDRFNTVWVGTFANGIYRIELKNENKALHAQLMQHLTDKESYYNRFISLLEINTGQILAGTRFDGLYIFDNSSTAATLNKVLSTGEGLANNYVTSLAQSGDGTIWIGSNTGFNRLRIKDGQYRISNVSRYYNFNNPISYLLAEGNYLWGSTDIGSFRMKISEEKRYDLEICFKQVLFPDTIIQVYSREASLSFGARQRSFTVSFTSPFYTNEQQTRYHYRLVHNGKGEWTEIHGNHSINFNSLEPGKYLLELRPTAFNGQPSKNIARLRFRIAAPFYQSGWFTSLLIACALLLAYAFYRYRIRELKKLYLVRDNISKNLHDEIGATLSSINIYSDVARKKTHAGSEALPLLDKIYSGSAQAMESINDIVWYVNPQNDSWDNIVVRMREFAIPVLEAREIDVDFAVDEKLLTHRLSMKQRQNVYFIFKEAVNNIVKYAQASAVKITLTRSGHDIRLSIEDNGTGFNPARQSRGNGLRNMQQRAASIKGSLQVNSEPGKGTGIFLQFSIA